MTPSVTVAAGDGAAGPPGGAARVPVMTAAPYPSARRLDLTENLYGHWVSDPYRWLEDSGSDETRTWLRAQDDLFRAYGGALPGAAGLAGRILELTGTGHIGVPVWRGTRRFCLPLVSRAPEGARLPPRLLPARQSRPCRAQPGPRARPQEGSRAVSRPSQGPA